MKAPRPPSGAPWLHESKHDGFRVIARKDGARVRLYSRPGNDLTDRFSLIVEALAGLRSRSCIIDGEAVACDERGIAAFGLIRYRPNDGCVFLYAFDLIESNGDDLRRAVCAGEPKSREAGKARIFMPAWQSFEKTLAAAFEERKGSTMNRRTALALTIGLSSIGLLAGNRIGHAQQSDADKVKTAIDGFHTAISSLDIRKMDDVWAHEPYAMVVNPRDKTVTVGWDAIRKNFEGTVFQFWSELKVTGRDAPTIHIKGETAWATGISVASGKPKAGGDVINAPTFESAVFEKRGDRWLVVSWSAWRVPQ
jgi:ketosteroid isomerase-like protein